MLTRRSLVAFAALALVAGCSGNADFTITKHYTNIAPTGGAIAPTTTPVDLSAEAGSAWKHRSALKSLDLVGLDATVVKINSGGPATVSGTVTIIRGGTRVLIGSWAGEQVTAAPHSVNVVLNQAGNDLLNQAIHDDGKFDVEYAGSVVGTMNFDADVSLHVKAKYKITPF